MDHNLKLFYAVFLLSTGLACSKPLHQLEKRATAADTLGDLTADAAGILNSGYAPRASCKALKDDGFSNSGLYTINPGTSDFTVFCDMDVQGGGWTVIQRRVNNSEDFNKEWKEYQVGFGHFEANFWLGLQKIKEITDFETNELYIGLQSFDTTDEFASAKYSSITLKGETDKYELTIGSYTGTAGDAFDEHDGAKFSAKDQDNDAHGTKHCASDLSSGWWYSNFCHDAHLNGIYYGFPGTLADPQVHDGIIWQQWKGNLESLKTVVMAVRPS